MMQGADMKPAVHVFVALCGFVVLVGGVYFIGEYRTGSALRARRQGVGVGMNPLPRGEPIEVRGLEGMMTAQGFLVTAVEGRQPLAALRVGDVVQAVGQQPVTHSAQLRTMGEGTPLQVLRGGQTLQIVLQTPRVGGIPAAEARAVDVRGIEGKLTDAGLWIRAVDGQARTWGLRPGDLLRKVNGVPLSVRRDASMLLRNADPKRGLQLEIVRDGTLLLLPNNGHRAAGAQQAVGRAPQPASNMAPALNPSASTYTPSWGLAAAGSLGLLGAAVGTTCSACGAYNPLGWGAPTCAQCGTPLHASAPQGLSAPAAGLQHAGGRPIRPVLGGR